MHNRSICVIFTLLLLSYNHAHSQESKIPNLSINLIDGTKAKIQDLAKDGPLIIDFWATWCIPCKKLMKHLNKFVLDYGDQGLTVLMINVDSPRSIGKVKTYIKSQDYQFLVGLDPNKIISKKLNNVVMPTTILVDKDGNIVWRHQGYVQGEEKLIKKQIEAILMNDYGNENDLPPDV